MPKKKKPPARSQPSRPAGPQEQEESPEERSEAAATDDGIGWLLSFGIVMALLLGARWGVTFIEDEEQRKGVLIGAVIALLFVPILRRMLLRALALSVFIAGAMFVAKNFNAIRREELSAGEVLVGIAKSTLALGPARQMRAIHAEALYGPYIAAVDARDPEINELASRITRECAVHDQACMASKIVRFVSTEVVYRADPVDDGLGGGDYVKPPKQTLAAGAGDCEDVTVLTLSLTASLGIESYMAFTDTHAFPIICFPELLSDLDYFRIGDSYCYHTEPTQRGSSIGVRKDTAAINAVVDPVRREQVPVRW